MDSRLKRLNQHIRAYDSDLYAHRTDQGMIQVMRKSVRWDAFEWDGLTVQYLKPQHQPVLPLTERWNYQSQPCEWGIEPILERLKFMDGWRDDTYWEEMKKNRESDKENRSRAQRNELRAAAADCRRDFAKAVNDINTSALEKVDSRRN